MHIELHEITIRELANGYQDNAEGGVVAFGGKLDVRPPYQREFVYKDKQRDAVITTVNQGFPLNVMYWADKGDGTYEVIDGQQRTISICQYVNGDFSYNLSYFHSLPSDQREKFLDYKLMVYICTGTDSEKLGWFKTINIAGEKLTDQELRNAVYCGSWVNSAKVCFSKSGCVAYKLASDYLNGSCIRQDYLETLDLIPSDDMERVFSTCAKVGVGIELNMTDMGFEDSEADQVLRMYRIAKACGCKFYCGSDSHHPEKFDTAAKVFNRAIDLLGLEETDKFIVK